MIAQHLQHKSFNLTEARSGSRAISSGSMSGENGHAAVRTVWEAQHWRRCGRRGAALAKRNLRVSVLR